MSISMGLDAEIPLKAFNGALLVDSMQSTVNLPDTEMVPEDA